MYYTYLQARDGGTVFPIVIRARAADASSLVPQVRAALRGVDAEVATDRVKPMTTVMAESVGRPRFYLTMLGAFAGVAVLLALAGAYGVMSYAVAQRTREFGSRSALGSTPSNTAVLVTVQGMRLVGAGLALGLVASLGVTRLFAEPPVRCEPDGCTSLGRRHAVACRGRHAGDADSGLAVVTSRSGDRDENRLGKASRP